jgi:hypothetical protein
MRVQGAAGQSAVSDEAWDRRADNILSVERLTRWCRQHIEPPPAALLYEATAAIERLKREMRDAE